MTYRQLYRKIRATLEQAGIEACGTESLMLLEHVCGLGRSGLILRGDENAPPEYEEKVTELCAQRIQGRPLQYILGEWTFAGNPFKVGEGVLIPRDDTEVLVNACADFLSLSENESSKAVDLCAGSGIIAVTLKRVFTQIQMTALEKSDTAFDYLLQNITLNKAEVKAVKGDVFTDFDRFEDGFFDLIVSNPPYIKTDEIRLLQAEVQREPFEALNGGADGYDFYRGIIHNWSRKLRIGGMLAFELGENQAETVKRLMLVEGFECISVFEDLGGVLRAITGIKG